MIYIFIPRFLDILPLKGVSFARERTVFTKALPSVLILLLTKLYFSSQQFRAAFSTYEFDNIIM